MRAAIFRDVYLSSHCVFRRLALLRYGFKDASIALYVPMVTFYTQQPIDWKVKPFTGHRQDRFRSEFFVSPFLQVCT